MTGSPIFSIVTVDGAIHLKCCDTNSHSCHAIPIRGEMLLVNSDQPIQDKMIGMHLFHKTPSRAERNHASISVKTLTCSNTDALLVPPLALLISTLFS